MDPETETTNSGGASATATSGTDATAGPTSTAVAPDSSGAYNNPDADVEAHKADSWGTKVYHGILDALGGSGDVQYSRDSQTGKMTATPVKSGPGSQWKRIISGALAGAGAGMANSGTGPGSPGRAFGAGMEATMARNRQQRQQAQSEANQDFEAQQKAAVQNAQLALLSHQIAKSTFDLGRAQIEASVADSDRETNFSKVMSEGGDGTHDMGMFPDFQSVMKAFKEVPELHDHQAGGRIIAIPHINSEGKVDGIHAALVTPDWLNSKINVDLPIVTRTYKDGKMQEQTFTIPAGSLNGLQYSQMVMSDSTRSVDDWTKIQDTNIKGAAEKSEEPLKKAQTAQAYSAAAKDAAEAKSLNTADNQMVINSNAQQLVEGTMDPSNLSKRGKTYDPTIAAANAYSMAKYGKPFDIAKASGDYKFATNVATYNTLNYLNSLVGRDNVSGNLGTVVNLSDKLGRTSFPPLNKVELWAKLSAGNPQVAAYRAALVETSDQIAKILQGGGSGAGTSDAKLKQAQDILNEGFNAAQVKDVAGTLRDLLGNRKKEIIGDNRYLEQWHGAPVGTPGPPGPTRPAAGGGGAAAPIKVQPGEPTAKGANGETLVVRNGAWVAAQP